MNKQRRMTRARRLRPIAQIGSVSSGTTRTEDLIPAFADVLRSVRGGSKFRSLISRADRLERDDEGYYADCDDSNDVLGELFSALNQVAPPYCYFGAHEGDGADYGWWPSELHDLDVLTVADSSELPAGFVGDYAIVNDHGNVTMMRKTRGHAARELWGIV